MALGTELLLLRPELCGNVLIMPWFLLAAFKLKSRLCKESAQMLVNTLVHIEVVIFKYIYISLSSVAHW